MQSHRFRLSAMMFLNIFIWGAWFPIISDYLKTQGFNAEWERPLIINMFHLAAITAVFFSTQIADRYFAAERFLAFSMLVAGVAMFGLKADSRIPSDEKQLLRTREVLSSPNVQFPQIISIHRIENSAIPGENGKYEYIVMDWFRKYDSPLDSFEDRARFLQSDRFKAAFQFSDPYDFAREIANAGYATAPNYYSVVSRVIRSLEKVQDTMKL